MNAHQLLERATKENLTLPERGVIKGGKYDRWRYKFQGVVLDLPGERWSPIGFSLLVSDPQGWPFPKSVTLWVGVGDFDGLFPPKRGGRGRLLSVKSMVLAALGSVDQIVSEAARR